MKTRIFEYLFDVLIKKMRKIEFSNYVSSKSIQHSLNVDGKNGSHRHAFKENTFCFMGDKAFVFSSMIIG